VRPEIMLMKNSSDTIGNRTRDLPASSAVSEPTAPPRASLVQGDYSIMFSDVLSGTRYCSFRLCTRLGI
jgi:hypothetical protein